VREIGLIVEKFPITIFNDFHALRGKHQHKADNLRRFLDSDYHLYHRRDAVYIKPNGCGSATILPMPPLPPQAKLAIYYQFAFVAIVACWFSLYTLDFIFCSLAAAAANVIFRNTLR
jgi:hypothetical protein